MTRDTQHEIISSFFIVTITGLLILNVRARDREIVQLRQQLSATVQCQSDILITQP